MNWWTKVRQQRRVFLLIAAGLAGLTPALAQTNFTTASRYIVDDELFEKEAGKQTEHLAKEGKLFNYSDLARRIPLQRATLALAPVATTPLPPTELAETLRHSTVAIGLRYQEPHARKWRFMIGATAFAVAPELLSTSLHVMTIDPRMMREAQAVAVTEEGKVYPITEIAASSDRGDTCLIRAPGLTLPPLPLRGGVCPGEPVWCMSHPDGFTYMFTSGQVARISRDRSDKKSSPGLHVEVTAEYCPGSSGGAVTDASGNVVAQVSSINNYDGFTSRDGKSVYGIVSARTCTAAEEIVALTVPGENEPVALPGPSPKPKHRTPKAQASPTPAPLRS